MNVGITAKLFLALLLTNLATAIAVGVGVRLAFDRGFERYVEEREETRQQRLAVVFADAYREHGNWEFLRENPSTWYDLNHAVRPSPRDMPPLRVRNRDGQGFPEGPPHGMRQPGGPGPNPDFAGPPD